METHQFRSIYMTDKTYEDLYPEVYQRWTDALSNCRSLHEAAKKNYRLYYSWERKDGYGYADNYDPAIGFRVIETERAYMRCNVLEPGISATREEDASKASVMNDIVRADYSTSANQKAMDDFYFNMLVGGTGVIKLGWSFREDLYWRWVKDDEELVKLSGEAASVLLNANTQSEVGLQLQQILSSGDVSLLREYLATNAIPNIRPEGGFTGFKVQDIAQSDMPRLEVVPIYDMAWLGSSSCIRDCDSIYRRFYLTRDRVAAMAKHPGDWTNLDTVLGAVGSRYGNTTSTSQQIDMECGRSVLPTKMVEFIEETRRDEDGTIWETIINIQTATVVRRRPMPYFHNQMPFFTIRQFGSVSDFAGISILTPVESSIGAYIKIYNEILENGQLAINKVFMTRIGGRQSAPQLHVCGGNLIAVESYDEIRPLDIPDIRPASMQLLQQVKSEIDEITGCPSMLNAIKGDTSGGNAGGLEQMQFAQTARFAATQHQIAVELSALTMQMVKLHQQYDFEGRTVYVEGDASQNGRFVHYEPADYAGQFEANSDPRSMLPTNNAVKRAQLLSAFNVLGRAKIAAVDEKTGQPVQEMIMNNREMAKEIAGTFDMLNNRHLFNRHGDITCLDPEALPAVPQPSQEQQQAASQPPASQQELSPEEMQALEQAAQQIGVPAQELLAQAQASVDQTRSQAQAPMEVQGGAQVTPEMAVQMNARDFSGGALGGMSGANGADTLTGTSGMPPVKGGAQQAGSSFDPNNIPNPKSTGDAVQSALSIQ